MESRARYGVGVGRARQPINVIRRQCAGGAALRHRAVYVTRSRVVTRPRSVEVEIERVRIPLNCNISECQSLSPRYAATRSDTLARAGRHEEKGGGETAVLVSRVQGRHRVATCVTSETASDA